MSHDQEKNTLSIEKSSIELGDIGTHIIDLQLDDNLGGKTKYKFKIMVQQRIIINETSHYNDNKTIIYTQNQTGNNTNLESISAKITKISVIGLV